MYWDKIIIFRNTEIQMFKASRVHISDGDGGKNVILIDMLLYVELIFYKTINIETAWLKYKLTFF